MNKKYKSPEKIIKFLIDVKLKKEKNYSKLKTLKKDFARELTKQNQEVKNEKK